MLSKWKNLKRWQKWVVVILGLAVLGKFFEIKLVLPRKQRQNQLRLSKRLLLSRKPKPKPRPRLNQQQFRLV